MNFSTKLPNCKLRTTQQKNFVPIYHLIIYKKWESTKTKKISLVVKQNTTEYCLIQA